MEQNELAHHIYFPRFVIGILNRFRNWFHCWTHFDIRKWRLSDSILEVSNKGPNSKAAFRNGKYIAKFIHSVEINPQDMNQGENPFNL